MGIQQQKKNRHTKFILAHSCAEGSDFFFVPLTEAIQIKYLKDVRAEPPGNCGCLASVDKDISH